MVCVKEVCDVLKTLMLLAPLLLILLAIGGLPMNGPSAQALSGKYFDHLVTILMENHNIDAILGVATFMTNLANSNSLATHYTAITHPSEPNYLAMIAGQTFDPPSGNDKYHVFHATNLITRFQAAGITWKAFSESASGPCSTRDPDIRHVPFLFFADVINNGWCSNVLPAGARDSALLGVLSNSASAPNYLWLTPSDDHNMHDNSVLSGDAYLASLVPQILSSRTFTTSRAALLIVFDEGSGAYPTDYVYAVWAGPVVNKGYFSSAPYNHYSYLKTIEANWGLPSITSNDAGASVMSEFFSTPPTPPPNLPHNMTSGGGRGVRD